MIFKQNLIIFFLRKILKMSKIEKFRSLAREQALLSPSKFKHGAIITRGNKVYAVGFNNPRTTFLKKKDCCQHAEMAAATSFINSIVRRHPDRYRVQEVSQRQEIT